MAKPKDEEKKEKPLLHKLIIDTMGRQITELDMPGAKKMFDWIGTVLMAWLLTNGRLPPDAVPAIKDAAKKVLKKKSDDKEICKALEKLATELGFELPKEESGG